MFSFHFYINTILFLLIFTSQHTHFHHYHLLHWAIRLLSIFLRNCVFVHSHSMLNAVHRICNQMGNGWNTYLEYAFTNAWNASCSLVLPFAIECEDWRPEMHKHVSNWSRSLPRTWQKGKRYRFQLVIVRFRIAFTFSILIYAISTSAAAIAKRHRCHSSNRWQNWGHFVLVNDVFGSNLHFTNNTLKFENEPRHSKISVKTDLSGF